jgi:hypothetical protein
LRYIACILENTGDAVSLRVELRSLHVSLSVGSVCTLGNDTLGLLRRTLVLTTKTKTIRTIESPIGDRGNGDSGLEHS